MRTSRKTAGVTDLAVSVRESVGELAAEVAAEVKDRVAHGSELVAEAVTVARRDLADLIEPAPPSRRWRWLLAGGVAAAVAVALWAVLSRRPQQVEPPVRSVPRAVPSDDDASEPDAAPSGVGGRNGHGTT
jgi:hypothetical protein